MTLGGSPPQLTEERLDLRLTRLGLSACRDSRCPESGPGLCGGLDRPAAAPGGKQVSDKASSRERPNRDAATLPLEPHHSHFLLVERAPLCICSNPGSASADDPLCIRCDPTLKRSGHPVSARRGEEAGRGGRRALVAAAGGVRVGGGARGHPDAVGRRRRDLRPRRPGRA